LTKSQPYLPRHLASELEQALAFSSREPHWASISWKTALVRELFKSGRYLTLDDTAILEAVEADPIGQLASLRTSTGDSPVVIDDAQRSRALALAIKTLVDKDRRKGQFVLTGSSNVFTSAEVVDSLTGRV